MLVFNFYKYKRKILENSRKVKHFCTVSDPRLKILFFGTDNFSLPSLKILHDNLRQNQTKIESLEVVTSFKTPINTVRKYATENQIELHKWPACKESFDFHNFHIGIVVSFGYLIPANIISKFPMGMINLHASLLPRWRGAAPIVHSIANGDTFTGVSIMKVEPKHFDIGDVLYQEEVDIPKHMLMPELYEILSTKGAHLVLKTVENLPKCLQEFKKQDNQLASYAPKISPQMTEIHWHNMTANKIYNMYRALYGYKNLVTRLKESNIKIVEMNYREDYSFEENHPILQHSCGFVQYSKCDNSLIVLCQNRTFIKIIKLKVEGRKTMNALEFNNGFLKKTASIEQYFR